MSRVFSQSVPLTNFHKAVNTSQRIYGPVRECCILNYENIIESDFHPAVAAKIIGLAFINLVAAWEEYVEETFVRYLIGARSKTGFYPKLRLGPCENLTHARHVLVCGTESSDRPRYLHWSDYSWVVSAAKVFFVSGEPYTLVSDQFRMRLADAQTIRNRVAHSSTKAKSQFRKMSNRLAGDHPNAAMNRGFSPGVLLASQCPDYAFDSSWLDEKVSAGEHMWGDIFEAYTSMYIDLTNCITPFM